MITFTAILGDITHDHGVSAIVNAANETLLGGGGVDGAIHRVAGPGLLAECHALRGCKTGDAKLTGAYNLPCDHVIHTVGPIWYGGTRGEEALLANCYRRSLELATKYGICGIAFPSISTGIYGYPVDKAAKTAVATVLSYAKAHPDAFDKILWVLFDQRTFEAYNQEITATAF